MKRSFYFALVSSFLINIPLFYRWNCRREKHNDFIKLKFYKDITFAEGLESFYSKLKVHYPDVQNRTKNYVIYIWDSTSFEMLHKEQIQTIDSLAMSASEPNLNYFLITVMNEKISADFLRRNGIIIKKAKLLGDMDDFISGLYNNASIKRQKFVSMTKDSHRNTYNDCPDMTKLKQTSFYIILNSSGKVIYSNYNKWNLREDTSFLNKINSLSESRIKIIN